MLFSKGKYYDQLDQKLWQDLLYMQQLICKNVSFYVFTYLKSYQLPFHRRDDDKSKQSRMPHILFLPGWKVLAGTQACCTFSLNFKRINYVYHLVKETLIFRMCPRELTSLAIRTIPPACSVLPSFTAGSRRCLNGRGETTYCTDCYYHIRELHAPNTMRNFALHTNLFSSYP